MQLRPTASYVTPSTARQSRSQKPCFGSRSWSSAHTPRTKASLNTGYYLPRFCATQTFTGFDTHTVDKLDTLLKQCTYGPDFNKILEPSNNFHIQKTGSVGLTFRNFWQHQDTKLHALCGELAEKVGSALQDDPHINDLYDMVVVTGGAKHFFKGQYAYHAYLAMWPKTLETEERSMRDKLKGTASSGKFPPGVLVIDPTFGIMGVPGQDNCVTGYKLLRIRNVGESRSEATYDFQTYYACVRNNHILGFLSTLFPQQVAQPSDERLLAYSITPHNGSLAFHLHTRNKDQGQDPTEFDDADHLKALLTEEHPIQRFFDELNRQYKQLPEDTPTTA